MIEAYFAELEKTLPGFPSIRFYTLNKKIYNVKQGFIHGSILFHNGYRLEFVEVKDIEVQPKIKYRYQLLDDQQQLIFRYDNAPHYPSLATFPHHKHVGNPIEESAEPTLGGILLECLSTSRLRKKT